MRLNLLRSAFAHLCAGKKEHNDLGVRWTVALDLELELREGELARGVGPPLKCGAFSLQQFGELQSVARSACSNSGSFKQVWRVQLAAIGGASNHEWAKGDGVVVGEVVADTQALGERWTHSFACSAAVPEV